MRIASYPPKNWRQQRSSSALEGLLFACMPHTSRQHNTSSPSYKDGGRAEPQRKTGFGKRCKRVHEPTSSFYHTCLSHGATSRFVTIHSLLQIAQYPLDEETRITTGGC